MCGFHREITNSEDPYSLTRLRRPARGNSDIPPAPVQELVIARALSRVSLIYARGRLLLGGRPRGRRCRYVQVSARRAPTQVPAQMPSKVQQAEAAIGAVFARHRPVAGACRESVELAAQLAESRCEADYMLLAEAIGFGVSSLALLLRQLQLAVLSLELASAAEKRDSVREA